MTTNVDAIVIGSGQGGGPLASALANAGRRTVLIEREHVGGTCINEGCTPTKTMIASGRVAHLARRGADYGVHTGDIAIDMTTVRKRKRDMVDSFRSGSERRTKATDGLTLLMGEARFVGPKEVAVTLNEGDTQTFAAETIVINVGERPSALDIDGADGVPVLNSTTVMELDEVPSHLIVVGGGYIGLEFAQLFRRLGAEVTIVHRGGQLLSREDPDIAAEMRKILKGDGIRVLLNAKTTSVTGATGAIRLEVEVDGGSEAIGGSHLLTAAGRTPNSDALHLAAAGVETDKRGYIAVDEHLRTNVDGIHAIGDVTPGPKFTHISYDDYRILQANLIDGEMRSIADRLIPYTVFTDPQLGRVGLSEKDAKRADRAYRVARLPMSSSTN
jgi:pyruvate/2-oxoglutarate dehydrogenase complex dihydrolipoamide dehydrogenase (E3) component